MTDMREFYEEYWKWRKETNYLYKKWTPARFNITKSMIQIKKTPTHILDIGCGEGTLGKLLKQEFGNKIYVVGVDISKTALDMASEYYDETYQLDIEHNKIEEIIGNRCFDYIVSIEVLEHILRPEKALSKLKEVVKDDGNIIVSFPNFAFWKYRLDVLKGNFPKDQHIYCDIEHLHYFTLQSFTKLLEKSGWHIEQLDCDFYFPFLLRSMPVHIKRYFGRRYPSLFGNQIVIKATKLIT
jgi:methionine biosynthesis protein MetW